MDKQQSAFINDEKLYDKAPKSIPLPPPNIGIDTEGQFYDELITASQKNQIDISAIEGFTQVSQSRDQIYSLIDTMSQDSSIGAVLDTYAEDATERADSGRIVWVESSNDKAAKYITFLLDSMKVDKNIFAWTFSLCKYGDVYLRLYRESEYKKDPLLTKKQQEKNTDDSLKESVNIKAFPENDRYALYLEMEPNPADLFELTKFGQSYAYVKTEVPPMVDTMDTTSGANLNGSLNSYIYSFNRNDVSVYQPTEYVHGCLDNNINRATEEVQIFFPDESEEAEGITNTESYTYSVRRGQSILYNIFRLWRQLALLENSILLNRVTKSSIVRIIGVEVGDMAKEMVAPHLQGVKSLIEQKSAIKTGNSMQEYTNPGPIENNIYIPTRNGKGAITPQQIGGDVNVGQLTDLDYFRDKLYGALRVPKQYFGWTEDGAGFNGGQSLSIISSRYAKLVKRIQNVMCQMITDAINLILIDYGMDSYVGDFVIKMQSPTTQEEIDRRDNTSSKVGIVQDVMNLVGELDNPTAKLKILKSLLSEFISDTEVLTVIQEEIQRLESDTPTEETPEDDSTEVGGDDMPLPTSGGESGDTDASADEWNDILGDIGLDDTAEDSTETGEGTLPTPAELDIGDVSNNNNPNI